MARTEKRFGTANGVSNSTVTTLVAPSANRKNVIINATSRGTATLSIASTSGNGVMTLGTPVPGSATVTTSSPTAFITGTVVGGTPTNDMYDGATFSDDMTILASKTNQYAIVRSVINPQTGAVTNSVKSDDYMGYGSSPYIQYAISQSAQYRVPGSNSMKVYGNIGTTSNVSPGRETVITGMGVNPYSYLGSNYNGWQISLLEAGTNKYVINDYSVTMSSNNTVYARHAAYVKFKNHPTLSKVLYVIVGPSNQGAAKAGVWIRQPYGFNSTHNHIYSVNSINLDTSNNLLGGAESMFFPIDYNSQRNQFAIQSPTNNNWAGLNINNPIGTYSLPNPNQATNPGFRIVTDDATANAYPETRFWYEGTCVWPALPTGVNVPNGLTPVKAMKFSPDGTKLAVAYNRDYTGTGTAESVVVIYTWNAGASAWQHTHSSGSSLPYRPNNNDCMEWSDDSSVLCVAATDMKIYMWSPGLSGDGTKMVGTSVGPAMNNVATAGAAAHNSNAFTGNLHFTGNVTTGTQFSEVRYVPNAGSPYRFAAIVQSSGGGGSGYAPTSPYSITKVEGVSNVVYTTATNYVSMIGSNIPLVNGNVTQITGIVLESGEGLAVEASAGNVVDVNAYGVEIS
jgi:hypothetical protein